NCSLVRSLQSHLEWVAATASYPVTYSPSPPKLCSPSSEGVASGPVTSQRMYYKAPPHNPQVLTMSEIDPSDVNCMNQPFEAAPPDYLKHE
ncbi:hypothetical protein J6590_102913, partial [Homalodisca vitripennis]